MFFERVERDSSGYLGVGVPSMHAPGWELKSEARPRPCRGSVTRLAKVRWYPQQAGPVPKWQTIANDFDPPRIGYAGRFMSAKRMLRASRAPVF